VKVRLGGRGYEEITGFRREVDRTAELLGHYAASSGNCLPTFRDNLSVLSAMAKNADR